MGGDLGIRMWNKASVTQSTLRRLQGKVALVTGADTGIGSAAATAFAREGADIVAIYHDDPNKGLNIQRQIEHQGSHCLVLGGNIADRQFCNTAVYKTVEAYGQLDILANNVTVGCPVGILENPQTEYTERLLRDGIFALFQMVHAALKYVPDSSAIISTLSVAMWLDGSHSLGRKDVSANARAALARSLAKSGLSPWMLPMDMDCPPQTGHGNSLEHREKIVLSCVLLPSTDGSTMIGQMLGVTQL